MTSKLGTQTFPRMNMAGAYLLAMWCPVYRWRDSNLGSGTELGNSSCNAKGNFISAKHEGGSTDVQEGGGSSRSSDEALVMSVERRG
jgi:hypothetical protein